MEQVKYLILFIFLFCRLVGAEEFFNKNLSFKRAHVGIYVADVETKKEVFSCNAEQFFVPASLQKIVTSAAAIDILGENFCFQTDLGYQGTIDEKGVLQGDIWIRGGGDPTLSLEIFSKWEEALKKEGIEKVEGKVLVDASCFESAMASPHWHFEDLGNYYGAGASGLTIHKNAYTITFRPGKSEGTPATIEKIEPEVPQLLIQNEVTTGPAGSGDRVCIFGSEYSPLQFYRGTVPIDEPTFTVKGAIPDPASFCAATLSRRLNTAQGYEIVKNIKGKKISLHHTESLPLKEILQEMNHKSVNLYSEHLLKVIGKGQARKGTAEIAKFLKRFKIPAEVCDGSGLARTNYITAKGFVDLLCQIRNRSSYRAVYHSFPELGKEGTLNSFPAVSNALIRAKTGSMTHIYNIAGYLTLESGKEYAFCLLCNNYQGSLDEIKKEMHRFLTHLAKKL
ncbi:MAG TPA: D-alanyl-D-alanine carboxypeptidase/D-alanyl-D-alanine-endopeptidase [Rhabdochlamydiaceae bacterium]|nr:D-alanyl-D-alanine carboxypeptidase/D-alanyl-D-alanine-endopeptidase [Rhabdochlamydiaceae bacterium]